jgi:hypothetical protein
LEVLPSECVKNGVIILQLPKENVFNVAESKSFWGAIFLWKNVLNAPHI